MMADTPINVLVTTFAGLGLPRTLSIPVPPVLPICDLRRILLARLPAANVHYIITTNSRNELLASAVGPVASLLSRSSDDLLPLRIAVPLRGGKGGFGSQLRAAGGRMASRKKRNQGESNGSSRNLDGRRLRTVAEAKALAEYLAVRPEMEKKEKEARRKRWQEVVDTAGKREEEIRHGGKARLDGQWIEDKEDAAERTREAVQKVLHDRLHIHNLPRVDQNPVEVHTENHSTDSAGSRTGSSDGSASTLCQSGTEGRLPTTSVSSRPSFFGFDERDEFMSDEEQMIDAGSHNSAMVAE